MFTFLLFTISDNLSRCLYKEQKEFRHSHIVILKKNFLKMSRTSHKTLTRWRLFFRIIFGKLLAYKLKHNVAVSETISIFVEKNQLSCNFTLNICKGFCMKLLIVWNRSDASSQCEVIWTSRVIMWIYYDLGVKKMGGKTSQGTLLSTAEMFLIALQTFEINKWWCLGQGSNLRRCVSIFLFGLVLIFRYCGVAFVSFNSCPFVRSYV